MENNTNSSLPEDITELEALSQTYFNLYNSTQDKKYLEKFNEIQFRIAQLKSGVPVANTDNPPNTDNPSSTENPPSTDQPANSEKPVDTAKLAVVKKAIGIFNQMLDEYREICKLVSNNVLIKRKADQLEKRIQQLTSVANKGVSDSSFQFPDTAEVIETIKGVADSYAVVHNQTHQTVYLAKQKTLLALCSKYKSNGIEATTSASDSTTSDSSSSSATSNSSSSSTTTGETNSSGSSPTVTRPKVDQIKRPNRNGSGQVTRPSTTTTQHVEREDVTQYTGIETIVVPFELIGNVNAEVKKVKEGHGDGKIDYSAIAAVRATITREVINLPQENEGDTSRNRRGGTRVRDGIRRGQPSMSREEILAKRIRYYADITYNVKESTYEGKAGRADNLELTRRFFIDVTDRFPVHNTENRTESWEITPLNPDDYKQNALYTDYQILYPGDIRNKMKELMWFKFDYSKCNRETKVGSVNIPANTPVDWLWIDKYKPFGPGVEIADKEQIGVKGTITLKLKAVKTVKTRYVDDMTFSSVYQSRQGSADVLNIADEPKVVRQVLGHGYMMDQEYALPTSLSSSPVLNFDRLNADRHIVKTMSNGKIQHKWSAEGSDEYTREVSESLKVEVKGSLFGASFSNTTNTSSSSKLKEKKAYKLESAYWIFQDYVYKIDETDPAYLNAYLDPNFKDDIQNVLIAYQGKPQWGDKVDYFIRKYGTHVITGMVTGGRVDMNLSYEQRTTNASESKSFSNAASIGYHPTSATLVDKSPEGNSGRPSNRIPNNNSNGKSGGKESLDDLVIAVARGASSAEEAKKLVDKIRQADGGQKNPSGTPQGGGNKENGIDVSTMYELKETIERITDEKLEDFNLVMRGGNLMVNPFTDDNTSFDKWRNSFNSQNTVWCDYVAGYIVPIFKFAPDYNSYQILYKAWSDYCIKNHISCVPLGRGHITQPVTISGSKDNVTQYPGSPDNYDLNTTSKWPTGWRLTLDLVNISGTKTMALAVRFQVTRGKESDNSEPPARLKKNFDFNTQSQTNLILVDVNEFTSTDLANAVVDTSLVNPHFETQGVVYGDYAFDADDPRGWIDITKEVRETINANISDGRRCLIDLSDSNSKVEIHIDAKGRDDYNGMQVRFNLYLPYLKFNG